jgi:hypothetical protein
MTRHMWVKHSFVAIAALALVLARPHASAQQPQVFKTWASAE